VFDTKEYVWVRRRKIEGPQEEEKLSSPQGIGEKQGIKGQMIAQVLVSYRARDKIWGCA